MGDTRTLVPGWKKKGWPELVFVKRKFIVFMAQADTRQTQFHACWCVTALRTYLDTSFPFDAAVTIADNASTDGTWRIASELAATLDGVTAIHLDKKGRGRALRAAWSSSTAAVVAYMDVDLATGLDALLPLVAPLLSGHSDLAIGTRLAPAPTWCGAPDASSSPAATTCCCGRRCAARAPTPSAGSRRCAGRPPPSSSRWSRTRSGSSTPRCW